METLEIIKELALKLLSLPYKGHEGHPIFTDDNPISYYYDKINASKDMYEVLDCVNPSFRIRFVHLLYDDIDITLNVCGNLLAKYWNLITSTRHHPILNSETFLRWVINSDKEAWMSQDELNVYNGLPDIVTVYRGAKPYDKKALCWTLDESVAQKYADKVNGKVFAGKIQKKYIYAYLEKDKTLLIHYRFVKS